MWSVTICFLHPLVQASRKKTSAELQSQRIFLFKSSSRNKIAPPQTSLPLCKDPYLPVHIIRSPPGLSPLCPLCCARGLHWQPETPWLPFVPNPHGALHVPSSVTIPQNPLHCALEISQFTISKTTCSIRVLKVMPFRGIV